MTSFGINSFRLRRILQFLVFLCLSILAYCNQVKDLPITEGYLEIPEEKWLVDRPLPLDGKWNFYWQQLLTADQIKAIPNNSILVPVPKAWNEFLIDGKKLGSTGYATYRLRIKVPESIVGKILSIRIEYLPTAYRLFANEELLTEVGRVGENREHSLPQSLPKTTNMIVKSKEINLVLQISNFHHRLGGAIRGLYIGKPDTINALENSKRSRDLFSISILGTVLLYYFIIWIVRPIDKSSLLLSILCLILFGRALVQNQHFLAETFPLIRFEHELLIEYLAMYWAAAVGLQFFITFHHHKFNKYLLVASYFLATIYSLFALFTPTWIYTYTVLSYQYIIVITILFIIYLLTSAMRNGNRYAMYSLISVFFMFGTVIYDILIVEGKIDAPFLGSYGLVAMIIAQGIILAVKFSEAFDRVDETSQKLIQLNESLEDQIQKRTAELNESLKIAEKASAFKTEFLASMSHEIRTPMNAILGMADLLSHTSLTEEQKHFLDIFSSSSKTLINILNDILDLSKIENGNLEMDVYEFNPRVLIHDVVTIFELRKQNPNVTFRYDIDMTVPEICYGDSRRITQILFNLLSNAFKFTQVGKVELTLLCIEKNLKFEITDTGKGISEEKLGNLFTRYYQAHNSTRKEEVGTGLGLYITNRLVILMGGNIEVESSLNKGTVFKFNIPILDKSEVNLRESFGKITEDEIRKLKPWTNNGPKIFVVDDVQINLLVAKKVMKSLSEEILLSQGGMDAIEIYRENKFDIVLLDLHMPEMDGFQMIKVFREIDSLRGNHTPIIAFTANVTEHEQQTMRLAGFNDILAKPLEKNLLIEKMYFHLK